MAEFVTRLGGPEQVGGDRCVELESDHLDTLGEQRAHQRLGVVTAETHGRQGCGDRGVGEVFRRDPHDRVVPGPVRERRCRHDGEPGDWRSARLAFVRRSERHRIQAGKSGRRNGGRLADRQLGVQLAAIGRGDDRRGRTERFGEPRLERPELEEVEEPLDLGLGRTDHELVGDLHGGIPAQHADLEVLAHPGLGLPQRGAQLRRQFVEVGEDPVEPAIGGDQFGGGLFSDSGDTREVVAGVPAQGSVFRVLGRGHAGALEDPRLVVQRVVAHPAAVVQHLDMRIAHQLIGVTVARDDDDLIAAGGCLLGGRGDHVVGLEAGEFADRHAEGVEHLADQSHLLPQRIGGRLALGLVRRVGLVAERRFGAIERHQHLVWSLLLHHVDEHRREPEHGIGELAAGRGHVLGQGEERPIGERVAVEQ